MTRGPMERPPEARKARASRPPATAPPATRPSAPFALAIAIGLLLARAGGLVAGEPVEGQIIRDVRIEGNTTVAVETIRAKIFSRKDRPLIRDRADADRKALEDLKLFDDVRYEVEHAPDGKGVILIFKVVEMPVLTKVEFIGRKSVRLKSIEEVTGLKVGARANSSHAKLAVTQIKQLYEEKGFEQVEVKLLKGGAPDDREVRISIFEGPKFRTGEIDFVGNTFVPDSVLQTKLRSRKPLFGLIDAAGHYEKDGFDSDAAALAKYYEANGFLFVTVRPSVRAGADLGSRDVTFVVSEGPRCKVRNILIEGNRVFKAEDLKAKLKLPSGEFFSDTLEEADRKSILERYQSLGHIKCQVTGMPKVTDKDGIIDVLYKIDEGDEYYLGQLYFVGNMRTQDRVLRREANMAGLMPGERLSQFKIEKYQKRLQNTGYFGAPGQPNQKPPEVRYVNERPWTSPFGTDVIPGVVDVGEARMQNPADDAPVALPPMGPADSLQPVEPPPPPTMTPGGAAPLAPIGGDPSRPFSPPVDSLPPAIEGAPRRNGVATPPGQIDRPGFIGPFRNSGMNYDGRRPSPGPAGSIYDPSNPTGSSPGYLNNNINPNIGPDRQEPFTANKAYADVMASVDEAPTSRLMLGVGASSFGGLYGNLNFTENNFNILGIPRSFDDITQGRAFRGAGQQFSIDLSPGTLINYYNISFRDPYVFELPLGLTVSGYQWNRTYFDWREQRSGGRFGLGKQFGTQAYADVAFRIEDVSIYGFKYPAPAALLDVAGHTTLSTFRTSYRIDTRDNPFLPSSGGFFETALEQAVGTYFFTKGTVEGRKYYTTGSRPDGSGKRVLTFRGFFGATSRDTPIYERFFAGNLNSLRGFQFRGVGPYVMTVNTGGIMESLASVEYRFPWTANDNFQQVFFLDSGTVEGDYRLTNYRVSIGTGFRIMIPQIFKQIPIAVDLAFPVAKGPQDRVQYFNFSVGAIW